MENDKIKQYEYLKDAYLVVIESHRGVTIPDEVLNRYKGVYNDPKIKLKNTIKTYYDDALKGKSVEVAVKDGVIDVIFGNDGKKETVGRRMTTQKAATFEYLNQLLEKAVYAHSAENVDPRECGDVPRFHYFVNNANIGGVDVPIRIVIRELNLQTGTENRYYTHNPMKIARERRPR